MAAKPPKAFDVWFVTANTVYKAVPYNVVADWTQQGRLAGADMVRPTGTADAWVRVDGHELLADYLPPAAVARVAPAPKPSKPPKPAKPAEPAAALIPAEVVGDEAPPEPEPEGDPVELPEPEPGPTPSRFEDDDEVDMIPLIDISMVLLVFFIMIQAAGALAPVDVPEMRYAGQLTADPDAVTITVEKLNTENVYYSVRVGNAAPQPGHDQLPTPEAALKALNEALVGATRPPEVRIACRKDLPRERVYELRRELEPLRKRGVINSIVATVVEAPDK
ncbi:MAG: biopolymer transporter ExbD [Planctomycetes bacterium]|nr:biopolymer transporter ExbD [Planctomycetota bacterium]